MAPASPAPLWGPPTSPHPIPLPSVIPGTASQMGGVHSGWPEPLKEQVVEDFEYQAYLQRYVSALLILDNDLGN